MICCLCGNSGGDVFLTGPGWRVVRCTCGMIRTDSLDGQGISYDDNDYFVLRNRYVQQWDMFSRIFEHLMARISRFKTSGDLLDVGAGVGTLVAAASRKGFAAQGVEVSEWASAFAREEMGLDVKTGALEECRFPDSRFDVVTINHVLEHIEDPTMTLAEIRRIMKPNALLVIGVPNIGSIMARIKGARWASLRPEEHIWHFTPATLKQLVSQAGFREVAFESKENHVPAGWVGKDAIIRLINAVARLSGRSEAMLLFCEKVG